MIARSVDIPEDNYYWAVTVPAAEHISKPTHSSWKMGISRVSLEPLRDDTDGMLMFCVNWDCLIDRSVEFGLVATCVPLAKKVIIQRPM